MVDVKKIKKQVSKENKKNKKRRKTFKSIRRKGDIISIILMTLFYITVLAISAVFLLAIFISNVQIIDNTISYVNGYSASTVISGSMEPTLHVGDIVLIKKTDKVNYNDIITFISPDEEGVTYTHRIVAVGDGMYKTKGDANNSIDDFMAYDETILGVVKMRIPYLGKYLHLLSSKMPRYFIVVILVITAITTISYIVSIIKILKADLTEDEIETIKNQDLKKRKKIMELKLFKIKFQKIVKQRKTVGV